METVQRGNEEEIEELLKSDTIWYCGECMSCKTPLSALQHAGPRDHGIKKNIARTGIFCLFGKKGRQQYALKHVVGESILKRGYCVTPDLVKPKCTRARSRVEWIYEHLDDVYERMHSITANREPERYGKWIRKHG